MTDLLVLPPAAAFRQFHVDDDGTVSWKFRQSDLNTFFKCPEQARLDWTGRLERRETDATAIGTAMHAGIEVAVMDGTIDEGRDVAVATWRELEPTVNYVQVARASTAEKKVVHCYDLFVAEVLPQLPIIHEVEHEFDVPFADVDGELVRLGGTYDAFDEFGDLWDWKTASRPYEPWENRFKIQPTVYTCARWAEVGREGPIPEFNYAVMPKGNQPAQVLNVKRDQGNFDWLEKQIEAIVRLIKADLPHWPMNDQGWWCSSKWCTEYAAGRCRGAH